MTEARIISPNVLMLLGYLIVALAACAGLFGGYLAKLGHDQKVAAAQSNVVDTDAHDRPSVAPNKNQMGNINGNEGIATQGQHGDNIISK